MGSQIVTALVEQKGGITTNPDGITPEVSNPIEQQSITLVSNSSNIMEQKAGISANSSNIMEQRTGLSFNQDQSCPDDCFIEQKTAVRDTNGDDTPIEQIIFVTVNQRATSFPSQPMQQLLLSRNSTGANPMEQVTQISNSINLTQFDFAELLFPPCNSIKNPVTTNILWRIRDFGFSFDVETIIFTVNGLEVQDSSEFTVTAITNGLQLDYNPPNNFDFGSEVEVFLSISDNAVPANNFTYICRWQTVEDSQAPIIELISPTCNSTSVSTTAPVIFDVSDLGTGVDQDSITLAIEGITVCSGLSFSPISTVSGSGFRGTWTHADDPFRFGSSVSVAIEATDLSPLENSSLFVCCFDVEQSNVPEFINFIPEPCDTFVDNQTGLTFEVYGDVDGVDITTLEVRVDNKLRKVVVRPRILRSE